MNIASNATATGLLKKHPARWALVALLLVGGVSFLALRAPVPPALAPTPVTIAVPMQINSAPLLVASAQGLFLKAGVDVVSQPFDFGKDALKSVLDGQANLAVVADTPLIFALLDGAEIAILANISQTRRSLAIVSRNDRGIHQIEDLQGKSVGVTMGTNLPYFLDAMLQVHGVPSDKVKLVDLKSTALSSAALKEGRIDAAAVFQPFLAQLQAEMGDRIKVFYGEDVYAFRFMLVGKPAYIDSHPQEVRRVLRGLIAANQAIRSNPVEARLAVGAAIKVNEATLAQLFEPEDYLVSLDQAMLLALEDQTRWAMRKGLVPLGPTPNYLNAMKFQYLEAVLPSAVTIVH